MSQVMPGPQNQGPYPQSPYGQWVWREPSYAGRAVGVVLAGLLFVAAGIAYLFPWITSNDGQRYTLRQVNNLCNSGLGQFAQYLSGDAATSCQRVDYLNVLCVATLGLSLVSMVALGISMAVSKPRQVWINY